MISVLVSVGFWESSIGLSIDGSHCDYGSRPSVIPPAPPCIAATESCGELGLLLRDKLFSKARQSDRAGLVHCAFLECS